MTLPPLRHFAPGEPLTPEAISLVSCYLHENDKPHVGVAVTTELANEAVDWWKALSDWDRVDIAYYEYERKRGK